MKTFKCTLILAFILFSIANVALSQRPQQPPAPPRPVVSRASATLPEKEEERASLFPGRSVAVLGVTVTWNVTPEDVAPETEEAKRPVFGTVDIVGPKNSMKNLKLRDFNISQPGINLYIDEVYIKITGSFFHGDKLQTLSIHALKQSQKRNVTAAPQKLSFYVSHLCPVFLNEWKFSVSGEKETFPDGSEYYILTIENPETKERETTPLSRGANRPVGRYDIYIDGVYELTKTALLEINAGIDESIRGRDAYVARLKYEKDYPRYSTYEEFFDILGDRYGFKVEWTAYPGHPESIEYIRNEGMFAYSFGSGAVKDIVDYFPRNKGFGAEWKSPTHLQLWYKSYDRVLARREREAENKKVEEEFKKDYATVTRAYYFKTITSKTAKELIDPELDTYLLVNSGPSYSPRYWITKGEVPERNKLVAKSMEQCAADERTNALILTAIPKTHEKLEKILAKIDAVLEKTQKPKAAKPFLLSVTLLQGVRSPGKVEAQEDVAKLAKQFGLSDEDMEFLGVQGLEKVGQGIVHLVPERGEAGTAMVSLSANYSCTLEFQDVREPYLIVRGILRSKDPETTLLENTIYLECGKPTLLGITNLREALILLVQLRD